MHDYHAVVKAHVAVVKANVAFVKANIAVVKTDVARRLQKYECMNYARQEVLVLLQAEREGDGGG